jgi:hypothetical protein
MVSKCLTKKEKGDKSDANITVLPDLENPVAPKEETRDAGQIQEIIIPKPLLKINCKF